MQARLQLQPAVADWGCRDEGSAALLGEHQAFAREQVDSLADGDPRDIEFPDQFLERRQLCADAPDPARDPLPEQVGELHVARNGTVAEQ